MSRVNFVEQFNLMMEYARENFMHGRECMLWFDLFYFANRAATYNAESQTYEWPDDFFSVSNSELNSFGQFDKRAIETLRNSLKQRGLIDFVKGEKNKRNPTYRMNYLVRVGSKIVPNNTPNDVSNNAPNSVPNNVPNSTPRVSPTMPPESEVLGAKMRPTMPPNLNIKNISVNSDIGARKRTKQGGGEAYRARGGATNGGFVDLDNPPTGMGEFVPLPWDEVVSL